MKDDNPPSEFEARLQALWDRAQTGDEHAYRLALRQIASRLRAYFKRRLAAQMNDLEDLVQETLLALHLRRETYDPQFPVGAWMTAIARHKLVDHWRRHGRRDALHDELDDDDGLSPLTAPEEEHASRDLEQLLQALPQAQRQAIELTKLAGLSTAEASALTGQTESALKVQVHRGIKRLAAQIKQEIERAARGKTP